MFPLLAAAVAPAPPSALIESPDWMQLPRGEDIARYYPDNAQRKNIEGRAIAVCQATADGTLANCFVADEHPKGEHFGDALLRLSQLFRVKLVDKEGAATPGRWVRLPVNFRLPRPGAEDQSEFMIATACYGQVADQIEQAGGAVELWKASLFWYARIVQGVANSGGDAADAEAYASNSREAARDRRMVVPKGWDKDACLAKASGK